MDAVSILKEELAGLVLAYPKEDRTITDYYNVYELGMRVFCLETVPIYHIYRRLPPLFDASRHAQYYITLFNDTPLCHIPFFYWGDSSHNVLPLGQFVLGVRYYYTRSRSVEEEAAGVLKVRSAIQKLCAAEDDIRATSVALFRHHADDVRAIDSLWENIVSMGSGLCLPYILHYANRRLSTYSEYCENVGSLSRAMFQVLMTTYPGGQFRNSLEKHGIPSSYVELARSGFPPPYIKRIAETVLDLLHYIGQSPNEA